jgi:hypothetical protein
MKSIDIETPSIEMNDSTLDASGQRVGRIYGDTAEMLRLHNAYRPNVGGKYDLNKIRRKRGEYEYRQLQTAMQREHEKYCKENSLTALEYQAHFEEKPEVLETIYERALNSLPKQCKTILTSYGKK